MLLVPHLEMHMLCIDLGIHQTKPRQLVVLAIPLCNSCMIPWNGILGLGDIKWWGILFKTCSLEICPKSLACCWIKNGSFNINQPYIFVQKNIKEKLKIRKTLQVSFSQQSILNKASWKHFRIIRAFLFKSITINLCLISESKDFPL